MMPDSATLPAEKPAAETAAVTLFSPLAGWLGSLDELPDPVFAGRTVGDGVAIDPTGDTVFAPCDALVASVAATGHAVTLRLEGGAELLIHVGIDTVGMAGRGFTPLVVAEQRVEAGQALLRFDLDAVVQGASSAMTPFLLLESDEWVVRTLRGPGPVAVGDPVFGIAARAAAATASPPEEEDDGREVSRVIEVPLRHGIHARPAAAAAMRGAVRRDGADGARRTLGQLAQPGGDARARRAAA